jgi:hypothetical protein
MADGETMGDVVGIKRSWPSGTCRSHRIASDKVPEQVLLLDPVDSILGRILKPMSRLLELVKLLGASLVVEAERAAHPFDDAEDGPGLSPESVLVKVMHLESKGLFLGRRERKEGTRERERAVMSASGRRVRKKRQSGVGRMRTLTMESQSAGKNMAS